MTREAIRELKRTVRAGTAGSACESAREQGRESALALLERSIRFRHGRLAVLRLATAVEAGAPVADAQWRYCAIAAEASNDEALQAMFRCAALSASGAVAA